MNEKYIVITWEYGSHRDEFEIKRAYGPMTLEEAIKLDDKINKESYINATFTTLEEKYAK